MSRPEVHFHGHKVSDPTIRDTLRNVADVTGHDVDVTSGDRDHVPKGGSQTSDHLRGEAADFHVRGVGDQSAFQEIKDNAIKVFDEHAHFEVIDHGLNTHTQGGHLHIGHGHGESGVEFKVEGMDPAGHGHYTTVGHDPGGNLHPGPAEPSASEHSLWSQAAEWVTDALHWVTDCFSGSSTSDSHDSTPANDPSPPSEDPIQIDIGPSHLESDPPVDIGPLSDSGTSDSDTHDSYSHDSYSWSDEGSSGNSNSWWDSGDSGTSNSDNTSCSTYGNSSWASDDNYD